MHLPLEYGSQLLIRFNTYSPSKTNKQRSHRIYSEYVQSVFYELNPDFAQLVYNHIFMPENLQTSTDKTEGKPTVNRK